MTKNIIVIGSSSGIGLELVKQYAQDSNNQVWALSRFSSEDKEALFQDFQNVHARALDLSSINLESQLAAILTEIEKVDILINNAGYLVNKPFAELTRNDIEQSYQTNIIGIMLATQAIIKKANGEGMHIVNISSMGGFQGSVKFGGLAAYSSSKAAIVNFTELFAEEYKETTIRMNCLCLGSVQTKMLEQAFPGFEAQIQPTDMAKYIKEFSYIGYQFFNGKILPVSCTTP